jgi:hypothetical protein
VRIVAYSCLMILCAHTAAHGGWFSYDNYEDCMLDRMKGQPPMMYPTAERACKKKFGVEVDVYGGNVKWEFASTGISVTSASDGTDEYEITSAEFSFSPKSCNGSTEADFGKPVQLHFKGGSASMPFEMVGMQCAKASSFKGKYK